MGGVERSGLGGLEDKGRPFEQIVGNSPALEAVLQQVGRVGPTSSTVLIQGETGTGKELIAHAIHNVSPRCGRPYIKLNCAAIPFDLLESELFGHERGAFTGAIAQKIGRFEMADKGTLFLDEVGDIPLALQPKLLRVLQEQEFERLGSGRTHRVDVRVVAATHRDLAQMAKQSEFRSDLYYRLNVFPITLPPLRARSEDIEPLVRHYVGVCGRRIGRIIDCIPEEILSAFKSYPWPGNIRELQNLIERAVILSCDGVLPNPLLSNNQQTATVISNSTTLKEVDRALTLQAVEAAGWMIASPEGAAALTAWDRPGNIRELENFKRADSQTDKASVTDQYERRQRDEIVRALIVCKGRVSGADGAAGRLGINRATLYSQMRKHGIYAKQYAYRQSSSSA